MVASRPEVTLAELRAWLLARHQVTASLGPMHRTLARLGLTRKKRMARPLCKRLVRVWLISLRQRIRPVGTAVAKMEIRALRS